MPETFTELAAAKSIHQQGRIADAAAAYRQIILQAPDHHEAHHLLGLANLQTGDLASARRSIKAAIEIFPSAKYWTNLGIVENADGCHEAAISATEQALLLEPDFAAAMNVKGLALRSLTRIADAADAFRHAYAAAPDDLDILGNLSSTLVECNLPEEAVRYAALSTDHDRSTPAVLHNLSAAFVLLGEYEKAADHAQRLLDQNPNDLHAKNKLAVAAKEQGDLIRAETLYREVIATEPTLAEAHMNLAHSLLTRGEFSEGWRENEWRKKNHEDEIRTARLNCPVWTGQPLDGKRILLYVEQGIGDAVQFLRFAKVLANQGAEVIIECPLSLHAFVMQIPGITDVIAPGSTAPDIDYVSALLSVAAPLNLDWEGISATNEPYIFPHADRIARWRERLAVYPKPWIGLCWRGNPDFRGDRKRSLSLDQLQPVFSANPGTLISVHKGIGVAEISSAGSDIELVDFMDEADTGPDNFLDTSAILANLDLLVSTCTSVPHVAGALGIPVWLMLSYVPDWRWTLSGDETPWYPNHRLYRQPSLGDWKKVIETVADDLRALPKVNGSG